MMLIALATPPTAKMVKAIANGAHLSSTSKPGISSRGITAPRDRKSTRLNSSHMSISYAVFCLTKKRRAYLSELAHGTDGSSNLNYFVYNNSNQPTPDGWKFTERVADFRYLYFFFQGGADPQNLRSFPTRRASD